MWPNSPETEQPADNVVARYNCIFIMRITIRNNQDGTYHIAISDKFGESDGTYDSWDAVLKVLAGLKPI